MEIIRSVNNKFFEPNCNKSKSINELLQKIYPHIISLTNILIQNWKIDNSYKIPTFLPKEYLENIPFGGVIQQIIGSHASGQARAIINKIKKAKANKNPKKYQVEMMNKTDFNIKDMDINLNIDSRCIILHQSINNPYQYYAEIKFPVKDIGRKKFFIPITKTKQMESMEDKGFVLAKTIRFNSDGTLTFVYKKSIEQKTGNTSQAIDIGRNKVITRSDGHTSPSLKPLLNKIDRKKRNSKAYKKVKTEIKQFINKTIKENIDWDNIDTLYHEKLKDMKRYNKWGNKSHHWNVGHILQKLSSCAEENGVHLKPVYAAYSSQTCSDCGHVDKGNRNNEDFLCLSCGYIADADVNAAIVISQRGAIMNPSSKKYPVLTG